MKEKELKRLSRADLLEMLIDQSKELQEVRENLQQAEAELKKREIAISNAGSIEAAQAACREYVENTHKYCERQEPVRVPFYEPSIYARPTPPAPNAQQSGIPYDQYLQQVEYQPERRVVTIDYAPVQQRTARYMRVAETMERQKR